MRLIIRRLSESSIDLDNLFDYFNYELFDNELPKIPVSFEKYRAKGIAGLYYAQGAKSKITINSEIDEKKIDSILIHEMIHHWAEVMELTSRQHHDKNFKNKVDEINRITNNKYRVGYTEVSMASGQDDLELDYLYFLLALYNKNIAPKNLVKPIQVMSELDENMLSERMAQLNILGTRDVKTVYILKVEVNNNFLTKHYFNKIIDIYNPGGYNGMFAGEQDYHIVKLMKQSGEYEIEYYFDWNSKIFKKY